VVPILWYAIVYKIRRGWGFVLQSGCWERNSKLSKIQTDVKSIASHMGNHLRDVIHAYSNKFVFGKCHIAREKYFL